MSEEITKYGFNVVSKQLEGVNYIIIEDVDGVSNLMGCINLKKICCDDTFINDANLEMFFDSSISDMTFTIDVTYREDKEKIYKRINTILAGLLIAAGDTKWFLTRNKDAEKFKCENSKDSVFDVFSLRNEKWTKSIGIVLTADKETRVYEKYEIISVNVEAKCPRIIPHEGNDEVDETLETLSISERTQRALDSLVEKGLVKKIDKGDGSEVEYMRIK